MVRGVLYCIWNRLHSLDMASRPVLKVTKVCVSGSGSVTVLRKNNREPLGPEVESRLSYWADQSGRFP